VAIAAYTLAVVLDLFVVFIGVRFLLRPGPAAAGYGVPAKPDGDAAYLTIKGLRDGTSASWAWPCRPSPVPAPGHGSCSAWRSCRSSTP
jgi:hypothetical protein